MDTNIFDIPLMEKNSVAKAPAVQSATSCCAPSPTKAVCCTPSQSPAENGGACCAQPDDGSACCEE